MNNPIYGNAFISCSLRREDDSFVNLVEKIVCAQFWEPAGTVGRYDAAPVNTAELMRQNIPVADIIVIAATPRYLQEDIQTGQTSSAISEMLQVESGIAYASKKPILVFVQLGTNLGNFLHNVTQYITLDGTQVDLDQKWGLINRLFNNALHRVNQAKNMQSVNGFKQFLTGGLAIIGGLKILETMAEDDPQSRPYRKKRKY